MKLFQSILISCLLVFSTSAFAQENTTPAATEGEGQGTKELSTPQERHENRQERREDRREGRKERREERREDRKERREDRREARKERRQDRREARKERRENRREQRKEH